MKLPFETKEISQENYYQDKQYLSNSMMGMLKESPNKLNSYLNGKKESNDAFTIGDYLHTSILEPHKMDRFHVIDESQRPNTKVGMTGKDNKLWLYGLKDIYGEGNVISQKNADMCDNMMQSVLSKPECRKILDSAKYEQIFTNYIQDVDVKCMVDINRLEIDGSIWDIKTTQDSSLEGFRKSFYKYGYFRQAAFYMEITGATSFGFIVVSKQFPHEVGIYNVSKKSIDEGIKDYTRLIEKYKYYFLTEDKYRLINESVMTGIL